MPKYRVTEVTAAEIGAGHAEMYSALVKGLKAEGLKDDLIEAIATKMAMAAQSNSDGCSGQENPFDRVIQPARSTASSRVVGEM